MLPDIFKERVDQLVAPLVQEWMRNAREEFDSKSKEASAKGNRDSGWFIKELTRISVNAIDTRLKSIWEIMQRVLTAQRVSYSESLAGELKAHIESLIPDHCWKLMESWPRVKMKDLVEGQRMELASTRTRVLHKAYGEIDLFVDKLKTDHMNERRSTTKDIEQDFKILLSRDQAKGDFEEWSKVLSNENSQIGVFFVDLDNFKALNSKYTHTRVDQSFLPETMTLLEQITRLRGGAYRYGGDEYLVILPNCDTSEATGFAERVRAMYENHIFSLDNDNIHITVSIGLALWPSHGASYEAVLQKANDAETQAKGTKNCVVLAGIASPSIIPQSGLSLSAQKLASHLNITSQNALQHDPMEDAENLCQRLEISQEELGAVANELEEKGWVTLRKAMGMGKAGFSSLWATPLLFIESDHILKGWNVKNDARTLAQALLAEHDESSPLSKLDDKLKWGPRRINPSTAYLIRYDFVIPSMTMGAHPYIHHWIKGKPKLRRLIEQ